MWAAQLFDPINTALRSSLDDPVNKIAEPSYTDLLSLIADDRSGAAWYFDATANLQQTPAAGSGFYRLRRHGYDHKGNYLGMTLEPGSTNWVSNSSHNGAGVGVLGGGGSLPLGWGHWLSGVNGNLEIVALGVEHGMDYIDIRFDLDNQSGSQQYPFLRFVPNTEVPAVAGETWTGSLFLKKLAGDDLTAIADYVLSVQEYNATGGWLSSNNTSLPAPAIPSLDRYTKTFTLSHSDTAYVTMLFYFFLDPGEACDVTFRFYQPQLEELSFATSPIPTDGTATTRVADPQPVVAHSSAAAATGTLFVDYTMLAPTNSGDDRRIIEAGDSSSEISIWAAIAAETDVPWLGSRGGTTWRGSAAALPAENGDRVQAAIAYQASENLVVVNAAANSADAGTGAYTGPVGASWQIGAGAVGGFAVRDLRHYPQPLSQTEMEALTA